MNSQEHSVDVEHQQVLPDTTRVERSPSRGPQSHNPVEARYDSDSSGAEQHSPRNSAIISERRCVTSSGCKRTRRNGRGGGCGDRAVGSKISRRTRDLLLFLPSDGLMSFGLETDTVQSLWAAEDTPPITRASLSELDLNRIMNDPKLRHDLNFEREVAFRPNYQGAKGRDKKDRARYYWVALSVEFAIYSCRRTWMSKRRRPAPKLNFRPRLPRLFDNVKDVIKTLVPASQWPGLDQRIDIDLLMQELEKGVCDLVTLIEWIGDLLLASCSPLRDSTVKAMVAKIQDGVHRDVPRAIAEGLEELFGVLEIMKLVRNIPFILIEKELILIPGCRKPPNPVSTAHDA